MNPTTTTQIISSSFSLYNIVTTIGIVAVFTAFLYIGRKLQILDDLKITTNKIKVNIKVVSDFLTRNHSKFNPAELQAFSPLQLTKEGKTLIEDIGFNNVFGKHKHDFFQFIDSENPKLKYDVEVAAIKSLSALYDKDFMSFLKVFFYNNPNRTLQDTAPTLGIYIRDMYLAEHPEITV